MTEETDAIRWQKILDAWKRFARDHAVKMVEENRGDALSFMIDDPFPFRNIGSCPADELPADFKRPYAVAGARFVDGELRFHCEGRELP